MDEDKVNRVIELVNEDAAMDSSKIAREVNVSAEELREIYQQIRGQIGVKPFGASKFLLSVMEEDVLGDRGRLEKFKDGEFAFPDTLELHLGRDCQCSCRFCWRWLNEEWEEGDLGLYKGREGNPHLKKEDVENLLHDFRANGGKKLYLSGGLEFFISEIAEDVIKCAAKLGLQIKVYTNGVAACFDKQEFLDLILDNVESIRFSMHAIKPDTYADVVMPHSEKVVAEEYFEKVIGQIKKIVERRKQCEDPTEKAKVGISFLAIGRNFLELEEAIGEWKNAGVDSFFIAVDMKGAEEWFTKEQEKHFEKIMERIIDKSEGGSYAPMRVSGNRYVERHQIKLSEMCFIPFKHPVIDPWGHVYSCCYRAHPSLQHRKFELGKIPDEKLGEILKRSHDSNEIPLPQCAQCLDWDLMYNRCVNKILKDWGDGFPPESLPFIAKK